MDFTLSDDQKALRENIVRFARDVLNEGVVQRDREQVFPRELWRKCGEIGIQGLPVPEEWGGSGLDPLSTAIAIVGWIFPVLAHIATTAYVRFDSICTIPSTSSDRYRP